MIKLIVGPKGAGKTKTMIDMINESVRTSKGSINWAASVYSE